MLEPGAGDDSSALYLIDSKDGHVLLDIKQDRILKLNPVGARVWRLLAAGETESGIVQVISRQYGVDETRVAEDVRRLLKQLGDFKLSPRQSSLSDSISRSGDQSGKPSFPWYGQSSVRRLAPGVIPTLAALCGLAIFDVILHLFSMQALCSCVKAWPMRAVRKGSPDLVGKLCSAVDQAAMCYPKQSLCLQRSAVTTCLLRFYGVSARMIIAVRAVPFFAHAWVEVSDGVANDFQRVPKLYQAAASY